MAIEDSILAALDPDQRAVALATRGPVCVIAGAGTGKTRAITHRIAYAAAIGTMDPQKVLALTFTAKAAGEMRARLRTLGVPTVAARTIHSAALKQLLYFWPSVFGGRTPDLMTTKTGFLTEAINRAGLSGSLRATNRELMRDIAAEIEWAKVSQVGPTDYIDEVSKRMQKPRVTPEQMVQVYTAYESIKKQELAIDFEDVLLLCSAMLEEERDVRERVQDQYRYFTIDEYQDISPIQQRLINAWLGTRTDICVVGDPAQTIYSFAGATPVFLNSFTQRFPEAEVIRLTTGYRSTPEITFAANALLRHGTMGQELVAFNSHGSKPIVTGYGDEPAEIRGVMAQINALLVNGTQPQEVAILARTNAQLKGAEKAMLAQKIPYQVRNTERFFERREVRDFLKQVRQASVIPAEGQGWIDELRSLAQPYLTGEAIDGIAALLHLARELDDDDNFTPKTLRTYLREVEDRVQQNNPPTMPVVTLATLHAAKGLEWERVFLIGASDGQLPLTNSSGEAVIEEERRLFYVGITRAKADLHISYRGNPSQFLRESGLI
ncbi:ATP-dependent helicase [Candidatus Planktophila versatilis]|jgi:DNA helicase II / ATP-dependent DNA helicase PcrA|uniref:DNA 3'-5' helicase n=1 Tax=Candidatus Planktophila versatilis TaxID=1884905 RepID=A0ABM6MD87_9ACTN|nr:ATP-dependent helicase [Candidatus Planktophila versatilis]ASY16811.1 DNA helicase II / ATP-dependent DNA helicase PcrA [Candidatus Planktophila versatilis]